MKNLFLLLVAMLILFGAVTGAHAILIDRGGGMIYSTDLDVTWLQDANYAKTSGYDEDGMMTWDAAHAWVSNLSYGGYQDWRLPTFDPDNPDARTNPTLLHEMGYLSYVELNNPGNGSDDLQNAGPFINLMPDQNNNVGPWFWSGTETSPNNAWRFCFECG